MILLNYQVLQWEIGSWDCQSGIQTQINSILMQYLEKIQGLLGSMGQYIPYKNDQNWSGLTTHLFLAIIFQLHFSKSDYFHHFRLNFWSSFYNVFIFYQPNWAKLKWIISNDFSKCKLFIILSAWWQFIKHFVHSLNRLSIFRPEDFTAFFVLLWGVSVVFI